MCVVGIKSIYIYIERERERERESERERERERARARESVVCGFLFSVGFKDVGTGLGLAAQAGLAF